MPVEIALKEQFKHFGRLPDYRYLDGVWIKAIPKKALFVCPPFRHSSECDGFAGFHIFRFHFIRPESGLKFKLKIFHILFVQLTIKMFRHRPQAGDLFDNIRFGFIKTNSQRVLIVDGHVFKFLVAEIVVIPRRLNVFTTHHIEAKEEVRHLERFAIRITRIRIKPKKYRAPVRSNGPFLGQTGIISIAVWMRHHEIYCVVIEHVTPKRPVGVGSYKPKRTRVI